MDKKKIKYEYTQETVQMIVFVNNEFYGCTRHKFIVSAEVSRLSCPVGIILSIKFDLNYFVKYYLNCFTERYIRDPNLKIQLKF